MDKNKKMIAVIVAAMLLYFVINKNYGNNSSGNGNNGNSNTSGKKDLRLLSGTQTMRNDSQGQGHYGASRKKTDKKTGKTIRYKHNGLDLIVTEGDTIIAPFDGKVVRYGYPYNDTKDYQLIVIENNDGTIKMKIMYVTPVRVVGESFSKGVILATAQKISSRYNAAMKDHIHIEVYDNDVRKDPADYLQLN